MNCCARQVYLPPTLQNHQRTVTKEWAEPHLSREGQKFGLVLEEQKGGSVFQRKAIVCRFLTTGYFVPVHDSVVW